LDHKDIACYIAGLWEGDGHISIPVYDINGKITSKPELVPTNSVCGFPLKEGKLRSQNRLFETQAWVIPFHNNTVVVSGVCGEDNLGCDLFQKPRVMMRNPDLTTTVLIPKNAVFGFTLSQQHC